MTWRLHFRLTGWAGIEHPENDRVFPLGRQSPLAGGVAEVYMPPVADTEQLISAIGSKGQYRRRLCGDRKIYPVNNLR